MSKRDTKRVTHYSIQSQEWALDINPHKSTKKAKVKDRQTANREIENQLNEVEPNYYPTLWLQSRCCDEDVYCEICDGQKEGYITDGFK